MMHFSLVRKELVWLVLIDMLRVNLLVFFLLSLNNFFSPLVGQLKALTWALQITI